MNVALNVFEAASGKQAHKRTMRTHGGKKPPKPSWERDHPDQARLLKWARKQTVVTNDPDGDIVAFEIPQEPE